MNTKSSFANLVRSANGAYSTAYGPFVLQSALQPIFEQYPDGILDIVAFEGLARASRDGMAFPPAQFFPLVAPEDLCGLDSLLRSLHILNTGRLNRTRARIFVKFQPGLLVTAEAMRLEVEHLRLAAHEAGMSVDRIVCEVSAKDDLTASIALRFAHYIRATGFRIAVTDYGAQDNDIAFVRAMQPDYVKFDSRWVRDFMHNSAGFALLKVIVRQFADDGIRPIFEGLEDDDQVALCRDLDVPLVQGYALARPELAPTTFNERFPEMLVPPSPAAQREPPLFLATPRDERADEASQPRATQPRPRAARAFGRRTAG